MLGRILCVAAVMASTCWFSLDSVKCQRRSCIAAVPYGSCSHARASASVACTTYCLSVGGATHGTSQLLAVPNVPVPPLQHWVPLPMLYHAMSYIDPETGRPRGHMRMASNPLLDSVLLSLDVRSDGWRRADEFVRQGAPALVRVSGQCGGVLVQGGGRASAQQDSPRLARCPKAHGFLEVRS